MVQQYQETRTVEKGNPALQIGGSAVAGLGTAAVAREVFRHTNKTGNLEHIVKGTVDTVKDADVKSALGEIVNVKDSIIANAQELQTATGVEKILEIKEKTGGELAGTISKASNIVGKAKDADYTKVIGEIADKDQAAQTLKDTKEAFGETKKVTDKAMEAISGMSRNQKIGAVVAGIGALALTAYALRPKTEVVEGQSQGVVAGQGQGRGAH